MNLSETSNDALAGRPGRAFAWAAKSIERARRTSALAPLRAWSGRSLAGVAVLSAGCALQPPTEDLPLTEALDAEFRIDSTLDAGSMLSAGATDEPPGDVGEATVLPGKATTADAEGAVPSESSSESSAIETSPAAGSSEPVSIEGAVAEVGSDVERGDSARAGGPGAAGPATAGAASTGLVSTGPASSGTASSATASSAMGSAGPGSAGGSSASGGSAGEVAATGDSFRGDASTSEGIGSQPAELAEDAAARGASSAPLERVDTDDTVVDLQAVDRDPSMLDGSANVEDIERSSVDASVATAASADAAAPAEPTAEAVANAAFEVRTSATADELSMSYVIGGSGERTLVFLHGWCGNSDQWSRQMDLLSKQYRVVAVDLVGHGASRASQRESWTIPAFGDDVARMLEAEKLKDVILVGHAMGGPVALETAVRAGQRIAGVVGVDSLNRLTGDPDPQRFAEAAAGFEADYVGSMRTFIEQTVHASTGDAVREAILADAQDCDPATAIALLRHFGTYRAKTIAPRVECKVMCINSTSVETDTDGNRSLLTSFQSVPITDVGHWPHLEAPESFDSALLGAIESIAPPPEASTKTVRLASLSPVLYCDAPSELARFYIDELRFKETGRTGGDGDGEPDVLTLERDGIVITLQSNAARARDMGGDLRPTSAVLFLLVSDYAAELSKISREVRAGKNAVRELSSGSQQMTLNDPVGNVIIIQEQRGPAQQPGG